MLITSEIFEIMYLKYGINQQIGLVKLRSPAAVDFVKRLVRGEWGGGKFSNYS